MCTVTYLPDHNSGFILTHNRDEHFTRGIALLPERKLLHDTEVVYPVDANAGGTWIATADHFTLCLLNGGFEPHERTLPYRHSRGQIIVDFFRFLHVEHFVRDYNFTNIEPFTLIIIEHQNNQVNELIFDGKIICRNVVNQTTPHLWSSTTLYTREQRELRQQYFQRFLKAGQFAQQQIINFHKNKFESYDEEGIQINRSDILKTVSLTSISKTNNISMHYEDFIYNKIVQIAL